MDRKRNGLAVAGLAVMVMVSACSSTAVPSRPSTSSGAPTSPAALGTAGDLAFSRAESPGSTDRCPRRCSGSSTRMERSVPCSSREPRIESAPTWSPDGKSLATVGPGGLFLWTEGAGVTTLAGCPPASCDGYGPPAWSPDGSTIAFAGSRGGTEGIFTVAAGGGKPELLAGDLSLRGSPAWSPAGDSIAVIEQRGGPARILLVDPASGETRSEVDVPDLQIGEAVAWSPDGAWLAVEGRRTTAPHESGIFLIRPDGSGLELLTACPDDGCTDLAPSWSPDARSVAFTRGRCDEPGSDCFVGDVWIVRVADGRARPLTQGDPLDCCTAWRPGAA